MNALNQYFSKELREKLKARYGKVPSCSIIARDFSLLAKSTNPISVETARKWLNGDCLPHISRLRVLQTWLGIDLTAPEINGESLSQKNNIKSNNSQFIQLINDIESLDLESQQLITQLIKSLKAKRDRLDED